MRILVTGANGYLGRGIVKKLLDMGHYVFAVDLATESVDFRAHRFNNDLFSLEDPYSTLGRPEVVLHLAWRDGFKHKSDAHFEDFPKHYRFLKKMAASGVKMLSVMGTMHEVGFFNGPVDENTPCNPINNYGIAKNALREAVQQICIENGVVFQWLRAFYIVGEPNRGDSVFSKIFAASKEGNRFFPFNSGRNKYDFLDYDDFCFYVAKAVSQKSVVGIINVCSGIPISLSTRVEKFISDNGLDIELQYGAFPDRPYDSEAIWGDNTKITRIMKGE